MGTSLGSWRDLGTVFCRSCPLHIWLWKVLLGTVSWTVHACVCMGTALSVRARVHSGISFANLMNLIMDPVFSLCYIPDLTDKNSALPDLVKVFQGRKANILGRHNWSCWGHRQMQNVTHLVQLAVKNWNANRFRWEFQGSCLWAWMLVFRRALYGSVEGHTAPFAASTLTGRAGRQQRPAVVHAL